MSCRVGLLLVTVACIRSSPIHYDVSPLRMKRDNENATTMATFTVERLDAPIERIEIRLIDENSTKTAEAPPAPLQPAASGSSSLDSNLAAASADQYDVEYVSDVMVTRQDDSPTEFAPEQPGTESNSNSRAWDETANRAKDAEDGHRGQVEYVSDVMVTRQDDSPTELAPEPGRESTSGPRWDETAGHADGNGESGRRGQARAWLSFSTRRPSDNDDDLDMLPPEVEESSSDDEYEPVEECLLNRAELPLKTVQKLTEQARKLGKLIRTRNRLQQQYCINREQPQMNDEFRLCPIWRNEKKVHNYQLMRIKYCADYSKWPNASKLMSTYGDNLNLYETLYAFQKP
ncbi:hypothetical protein Q1695_002300 [Nippostrongylus brasiliensis]|nr:hypothetical protein Q1695_002300 [Nippostrongylus brasiliensis]